MKICKKCGAKKDFNQFHKLSKSKDLHSPVCKQCRRVEYDQIKASGYYIKNRERIIERNKIWRKANPEKVKFLITRWRQQNKERLLAYYKQYYIENKEKKVEARRKWREKRKLQMSLPLAIK